MGQENEYLKGNYELDTKINVEAETSWEATEEEFYRRGIEKLGGSIAFIMKKNLLWKGENTDGDKGTPGS